MNFYKILMFVIFVSLFAQNIYAKTGEIKRLDGSRISTDEIEKTVQRLMRNAKVTGLNLAIFNDAKLAYLKSFGFRDKEHNLPMTEETIVYGASLTKAVFSYFVMDLAAKGVIDLDKPIAQYLTKPLPEYENYRDLAGDERYKLLTLRMLLSHTSGFPNWRWLMPGEKLSINFQPGTRYAYSGEGISLAQFVVEAVTKRPLGEMLQERIFDRFGMRRTIMVWKPELEDNAALGYDQAEKPLGYQRKKKVGAAGSMNTTLTDYAKFFEAVIQGRDLKPQALAEMTKPQIQIFSKSQFPTLLTTTTDENRAVGLTYGLGWGVLKTPRGRAFFKEGHDDGWGNYSIYFPEKKIGIVMMSNSSNGESIFRELLETSIKDTYTPWKWENYIPYDYQAK